jgi:AraC-like DNA-binding protein
MLLGVPVRPHPGGVLASRASSCLLLPSGPTDLWGGASSVVMALEPADLARAAAAMAGKASTFAPSEGAAPGISQFQARELSVLQARQLHALLQHLDTCLGSHPALPARLGLDDVLLRLVVSWLQPQLLEETAADRRRIHGRAGGSSFDELIDTIRANLDQPLRLSDLEARSHYSSRALQYAFREQLGCTPRQWIREQRLEQALAQLEQGGRGCSIRAVALACGYRHMGLFSSDSKKRFGFTPSAVRWVGWGGVGGPQNDSEFALK